MSTSPGRPPPDPRERTHEDVMWGRLQRRRDRIVAEVRRNRAGGHRIPTWVLTAILGLLLLGWLYVLLFG